MAYSGSKVDHQRVIYTYGHAIENSLYCARIIAHLIADYSRNANIDILDVERWQSAIAEELKPLLVYDVAKYLFNSKHGTIMGDNCTRFLGDGKTPNASSENVTNFIGTIHSSFSQEQIDDAREQVTQDPRSTWSKIRGHFLTHAVMKFIKHRVHRLSEKSITMSLENLFVGCLGHLIQNPCQDVDLVYLQVQFDSLSRATD